MCPGLLLTERRRKTINVHMNERIGIFGGSFNPIHRAHLTMAAKVVERFQLCKLLLMPSRQPPHKSSDDLATGADRLAMCQLAAADEERIEVTDLELGRQGPSYTVDSLQDLRVEYPQAELLLVIGADMLKIFHQWVAFEQIHALVRLVTFPRPGVDLGELPELREALGDAAVERLLGDVLDVEPMEVSSTDVRNRVRAGQPIEHLVPPAVADYIARHNLYR